MKKLNDKIEKEEDKPLRYMTVEQTPTGFYKISHPEIKWYTGYSQVQNFNLALAQMVKQNIPYVFIRIGEDIDDIEVKNNWTDDMPDELETFEPQTDIYDESEDSYKTIMEDGMEKEYKDLFTPDSSSSSEETIDPTHIIKEVMFDLFDRYEYYDDINEALCSLYQRDKINTTEYNLAREFWDEWLKEWEEGDT